MNFNTILRGEKKRIERENKDKFNRILNKISELLTEEKATVFMVMDVITRIQSQNTASIANILNTSIEKTNKYAKILTDEGIKVNEYGDRI